MLTGQTKALTLKEEELKLAQDDYNWNNNLLSEANHKISSLKTELGETKNKLVLAQKKLEEKESDLARTESILARTESDLEIVRCKEKALSDYIRNKLLQKPPDFTNSQNQAYQDTPNLMQNMKEDVLEFNKTQKDFMDNERINLSDPKLKDVTKLIAYECANKALKQKVEDLNKQLKSTKINLKNMSKLKEEAEENLELYENQRNMTYTTSYEANSNQRNLQPSHKVSNNDLEYLMSYIQRGYKGSLWTNSTFYPPTENQQNDELELVENTTEPLANNLNPDKVYLERSETVKFYKMKSVNDKLYSLQIPTDEPEMQNRNIEDFLIQYYRLTMEINNKVEELKTESGIQCLNKESEKQQKVYIDFEKKIEGTLLTYLNDFKHKYQKDIEKVNKQMKQIQTEYAQKKAILDEEKKKNDDEIKSAREKIQKVQEQNKLLNVTVIQQNKAIEKLQQEINIYLG